METCAIIEFLRELSNTTEKSWYYWPLLVLAIFLWCTGFALFCGGIGYAAKLTYKRNKYVFWAATISIALLLWLWLTSEENVLDALETVIEKICFWVLIPLGVLAWIAAGIEAVKRLVVQVLKKDVRGTKNKPITISGGKALCGILLRNGGFSTERFSW